MVHIVPTERAPCLPDGTAPSAVYECGHGCGSVRALCVVTKHSVSGCGHACRHQGGRLGPTPLCRVGSARQHDLCMLCAHAQRWARQSLHGTGCAVALRRAPVPAADAGPRAQGRVPPLRQARRQGRRRPHPAQQAGARLQGRVQPRAPGAARPLPERPRGPQPSARGQAAARRRRLSAPLGSRGARSGRPCCVGGQQQAPSRMHPHRASLPCMRCITASGLPRERRQTPAQPPTLVRLPAKVGRGGAMWRGAGGALPKACTLSPGVRQPR